MKVNYDAIIIVFQCNLVKEVEAHQQGLIMTLQTVIKESVLTRELWFGFYRGNKLGIKNLLSFY